MLRFEVVILTVVCMCACARPFQLHEHACGLAAVELLFACCDMAGACPGFACSCKIRKPFAAACCSCPGQQFVSCVNSQSINK
jgi:hypothetical protein